jgi:HK97 family phage portal protein
LNPYSQYICGNDGDALEIRNDATSGTYQPADWFAEWMSGGRSAAGVRVNGYTALTHCPLWQGVNIIAGDFGQTPVRLLKNEFNEQRLHPSWSLLRVAPNELQTPSVWKETMMQWALIWGNGVSWIRRQGSRPVELVPLRPDCLWHEVLAFEDQKIVLYHYKGPYRNSPQYTFFPDDVVHFKGLTSDGVWGYPLWQIAKDTIGQGLAIEKHGNSTFANGARPGGVLQHPAKLSPEAVANIRTEWNKVHSGPDNAGKIAILWEDMKFNPVAQSNTDSQWIEAKKMSVLEAASLLNLPPHKLGAMEDTANRATLEEQNADYVSRTMNRWYNKADEEYRKKLLTDKEWKSDEFCFQHQADAFLKGDIDTLTTVADRCVKATLMNPNEGRKMIGLPPYKGGEVYGSPAINPIQKGPEDGKAAPDNGRPRNAVFEEPTASTIVAALGLVCQQEINAVSSAARTKKNFIGWLDGFYGTKTRRGQIVDLIDKAMENVPRESKEHRKVRNRFKKWSLKRRELLLEVCGKVDRAGFDEAIENFLFSGDHHRWLPMEQNNQWRLGTWDSE